MQNKFYSKHYKGVNSPKKYLWGVQSLLVPMTFNDEVSPTTDLDYSPEQHSFHFVDFFFFAIFTGLSFFQFFLYWFHVRGPDILFFGLKALDFSYYFAGLVHPTLCIFWWCLSALCPVFKCRKLSFLYFVNVREDSIKISLLALFQLGLFLVYYIATSFFYVMPWIVAVLLVSLNQLLHCVFLWPPVASRVIYQILIFLFLFSSMNLLLFSFWYSFFQADTLMTVSFVCAGIFYTVLLVSCLPLRKLFFFLVFFMVWYHVFSYSVLAMFFFTALFIGLIVMDWNNSFTEFLKGNN